MHFEGLNTFAKPLYVAMEICEDGEKGTVVEPFRPNHYETIILSVIFRSDGVIRAC
jgi:hypothetical protein